MKKVLKFVKGKKDEKKDGGGGSGGMTPSQSGDLVSPAQTPEDERFLGLDSSSGYVVDFGGKDKTLTKLHKAAWQGNLEKLKSALKKVDVDATDKNNRTALHLAVAQGHPNIVWFLLGNNAKTSIVDDGGYTPLLKAIECGHKECTKLLLDRGTDVNVTDYTGNSGLHVAVSQGAVDTVTLLLKKGADPEIANNAGDFPLHIATKLENKELIDLLLNANASVDVLDRENRTPLMLAGKSGNDLLTRMFVERGAQLTIVDSNGWTAHDYAMLAGHEGVAASLKPVTKKLEKKKEEVQTTSKEDAESWNDSQTDESGKESVGKKIKKFFEKTSVAGSDSTSKEKSEDLSESPEVQAIPPYCQPPRSWEMIQAGMIDENQNGSEPKRRSITALGTLRSRRESFTEGSVTSPKSTLSLNRRKGAKGSNAFAKQRFSFNDEESLKYWLSEEKAIRKDLEKIELENMLHLEELAGPKNRESSPSESDWDTTSVGDSQGGRPQLEKTGSLRPNSDKCSDDGTLGKEGTMRGTDELWVTNSHPSPAKSSERPASNSWDSEDAKSDREENFPPPPTALELGVDMAKSIKYTRGMSIDQPPELLFGRHRWKNVYESHSLDRLDEKEYPDSTKTNAFKAYANNETAALEETDEKFKCQKSRDRVADVNKRISEQLECYDQALRELAETSKIPKDSQNYYSLPCMKTSSGGESRRANSQELILDELTHNGNGGPRSLPVSTNRSTPDNNETLGSDDLPEKSQEPKEPERKTKRHMLLAMRDVKHAVHVTNNFKTSVDDQILSPLTKPEDSSDSGSHEDSPADENPFFGLGRQETVLERNDRRKSSSSGTGEDSTLWLQDAARRKEARSPDSDRDAPEMVADEDSRYLRQTSFSPLGIIQREMEEESAFSGVEAPQTLRTGNGSVPYSQLQRSENEEDPGGEHSPDISLSSGPIEPIGAEKDSGSDPETSHNDVSPSHNFTLKSQHEWLKSHLRVATSEKNKLEELTARLSEKAERLQYELADAKEAAKSRDEVIRLLREQLARMEAAYTKSLEESVQSRLQLTSHEQEILHLKELCFRYEEEKEAALTEETELKIKSLEEEKERMRGEIARLEEEKTSLEKRMREEIEKEKEEQKAQCQRWKERCANLEAMAKSYGSQQSAYESYVKKESFLEQETQLKQINFYLEKKYLDVNEENIELRSRVKSLTTELEAEKKTKSSKDEYSERVYELKRKNAELERCLKVIEKEWEEKMVKKLKEKEAEVGGLVRQFNRERDSLIASYEKKLKEGGTVQDADLATQNRILKDMVNGLKNRLQQVDSGRLSPAPDTLKENLEALSEENLSLRNRIEALERKTTNGHAETEEGRVLSEIKKLKGEVENLRKRTSAEKGTSEGSEGRRRGVGREGELAWSSLYGMTSGRKRRSGRSLSVAEKLEEDWERNKKFEDSDEEKKKALNGEEKERGILGKVELLELKKEMLFLQSKMSDEKNLRHALENEILRMKLEGKEKEKLEEEMKRWKEKAGRESGKRWEAEAEMAEFRKELDEARERCLAGGGEPAPQRDDRRERCEVLAREREKARRLRKVQVCGRSQSFDCPPSTLDSFPRSSPRILVQHNFLALDPDLRHKLDRDLDKSIHRYLRECSSTPSISTLKNPVFGKKLFN